ncbi:MAG: rhomboid family intramembrane serine protease, partial [Candidatus Electrothrix sp. AR3]|nr:rhomboid family intramembrane serine protease [Candidatus Electrothrix sp. AR3]
AIVNLLCRTIGYGTGWLSLLLSGAIGNLFNIILRSDAHYSVGFSTAIFAAIGILCGRSLIGNQSSLIRQMILPLGAGAGMLAMLGSGGQRTDLGAHLFGLIAGLLCGLLLQVFGFDQYGEERGLQRILFFSALIFIIFCWMLATRSGLKI